MKRFVCSIIIFAFVMPALGQDCVDYSTLPGVLGSTEVSGSVSRLRADNDNFCFLSSTNPLTIEWGTITDGTPGIIGEFVIPDRYLRPPLSFQDPLVCYKTFACMILLDDRDTQIANSSWSLIDFSNPTSPVQIEIAESSHISSMEVANGVVFLSTADGLKVYDISTPSEPIEIITTPEMNTGRIAEDHGVLYVYRNGEDSTSCIFAYDISDPATPQLLGEFLVGKRDWYDMRVIGFDASDETLAISYRRKIEGSPFSSYDYFSHIFDVSIPSAMVETKNTKSSIHSIVADMKNGVICISNSEEIRFLNKVDGSWVTNHRLANNSFGSMVLAGNTLLYNDPDNDQLVTYSAGPGLATPAAGTLDLPTASNHSQLIGTHAIIFSISCRYEEHYGTTCSFRRKAYDLSDPANPVFMHDLSLDPIHPLDWPHFDFIVHGDYVYSDRGSIHWPTDEPLVSTVSLKGSSHIKDDVLYANQEEGFLLYDISTPDTPVQIGETFLGEIYIFEIISDDNYLYVFGNETYIFDITSPTEPVYLATSSIVCRNKVVISDGLLYSADSSGLNIYNISSALEPVLLSTTDTGNYSDVAVSDGIAHVIKADGLLELYDVRNPVEPNFLGNFHCGCSGYNVHISNGQIYTTCSERLQVLNPACLEPTPTYLQTSQTSRTNGQAIFSWEVSEATLASNFRVEARSNGDLSLLTTHIDAPGHYSATAPREFTGEITFDLYVNNGSYWELLTREILEPASIPALTKLVGVYPNPFNPQAEISFNLAKNGPVEITVYDLAGRKVAVLASGYHEAGRHTVTWSGTDSSGRDQASGTYLVQLRSDQAVDNQKLLLAR